MAPGVVGWGGHSGRVGQGHRGGCFQLLFVLSSPGPAHGRTFLVSRLPLILSFFYAVFDLHWSDFLSVVLAFLRFSQLLLF